MILTAIRSFHYKGLRYSSPWFRLLCLGLASALAFLPIGGSDYPYLLRDTLDALHFPAGALLFICIARLHASSSIRSWWMSLAITATALILVELLQGLIGRNADALDALRGLAGASSSAVILSRSRTLTRDGVRYSANWIALALVTSCAPSAIDWIHYSRMMLKPEFIADFEWPGSGRLWQRQWGPSAQPPVLRIAARDNKSRTLEVGAREGGWSGVSIEVPIQHTHTRGLTFSVKNPSRPFQLIVRLSFVGPHGLWSSDSAVQVLSGWSQIDVIAPIAQSYNEPNRLREVLFYVKGSDGVRRFYLDDIRRLTGG